MRIKTIVAIPVFVWVVAGCDGVGLFNETGIPSGVYNGTISISQGGSVGADARETSTLSVTIDVNGFPADGANLLQRLVGNSALVDLDERTLRDRTVRTVRRSGDTVMIDSKLEITVTEESPFAGFPSGRRQFAISGSATESYLNAPPNIIFSSQATLNVTELAGPLVGSAPQQASRSESGVLTRR